MEYIDLAKNWDRLVSEPKRPFSIKAYCEFIEQAIPPEYRRGNPAYQYQLFQNGYGLERAFKLLNRYIFYIENNHDKLYGGRGNSIPDFKYDDGETSFTFDTKTFKDVETFNNTPGGQLNHADYVIAFIISERKFYIRWRRFKAEYSPAVSLKELPEAVARNINLITFPTTVQMVKFHQETAQDAEVQYEVIPYLVNNN